MISIKHRVLAIVFTVLCLFSSVQMVLNHHFCCDELVSICVNEVSDACCHDYSDHHNGNEQLTSDCCDDEAFLIEAFDFLAGSETLIPDGSFTKVNNVLEERTLSILTLKSFVGQDFASPPDHFSQRLFCVYRI